MTRTNPTGPITPGPDIDVRGVALDQVRTAADLAACLERVRKLAGPLAHRELDRLSGGRLGRTKISQVLAGELPRRDFLMTYLTVCGVPEPDRADWCDVWVRLVVGRPPAGPPDTPGRPPDTDTDTTALRAELTRVAGELARVTRELDRVRRTGQRQLDDATAERDRAIAHVGELTRELRAIRAPVAERDATRRAPAPDNAARGQVRSLVEQLDGARKRIAELERDEQLRRSHGSDEQEAPTSGSRMVRYSQQEADALYGSPDLVGPGTIGGSWHPRDR